MAVAAEPALKRVQAARAAILDVFQRSETENLRILARVCAQMDALFAAGVQALTEAEVRFLTAVVIHVSTGFTEGDDFFAFNPFVLRVTSSMTAGKPKEPLTTARQAFLERYFGETDY